MQHDVAHTVKISDGDKALLKRFIERVVRLSFGKLFSELSEHPKVKEEISRIEEEVLNEIQNQTNEERNLFLAVMQSLMTLDDAMFCRRIGDLSLM